MKKEWSNLSDNWGWPMKITSLWNRSDGDRVSSIERTQKNSTGRIKKYPRVKERGGNERRSRDGMMEIVGGTNQSVILAHSRCSRRECVKIDLTPVRQEHVRVW